MGGGGGRGRMSWLGADRLGLGIRVGRRKKKRPVVLFIMIGEAWRCELVGS